MFTSIYRASDETDIPMSWTMDTRFEFGWVILRIYVALTIFQSYLDLEAGDNKSLKFRATRPGIEPRIPCSATQENATTDTRFEQNIFAKQY